MSISSFTVLEELDVSKSDVTEIGLAYLGQIRTLQCVSAGRCKTIEVGVGQLASLENLRELNLPGFVMRDMTPEPEISLSHLKICANLVKLDIFYCTVSKNETKGYACIAGLPLLEELRCQQVDKTGLEHIAKIPRLRVLEIR